jgi:signal transduction histidine kinase/CheY-like chemotaxis protein
VKRNLANRLLARPILGLTAYVRAMTLSRAGTPARPQGPRETARLIEEVARLKQELMQKDELLRRAQRMESVASLAGAMAHDFNNLLTGILGYTRLLLDRVGPGDPIRRQLAAIENSATRAADLTARLLTFSGGTASRPAPSSLALALGPTIEAVRDTLPPGIDLSFRAAEDLWATAVDSSHIERTLSALCANARDAMPFGGRLTIGLANLVLGLEECRGRPDARPGRFVALTVTDTGSGLAPEIRGRLFEPFVTTKQSSGGAGLGLSTAYGLVQGYQGWIEAATASPRGTCFTVFLPAWDVPSAVETATAANPTPLPSTLPPSTPPPATRPPEAPTAAAPAESATILVVDDESTVLALARDVLEMHGHHVLTARNGEEALRVFREHQASIRLVVLDLTMPVMGGLECFRRMRQQDPGVRVVISSGFSSESSAGEVLDEGALDYLQKPYDIDALARTVAAALAKSASPTTAPARAAR